MYLRNRFFFVVYHNVAFSKQNHVPCFFFCFFLLQWLIGFNPTRITKIRRSIALSSVSVPEMWPGHVPRIRSNKRLSYKSYL